MAPQVAKEPPGGVVSKWIGSVTPNSINLTRVGSGDNLLKLLVLAAAIALPLTIIVAWATQIEIALTILATLGLDGPGITASVLKAHAASVADFD